MKLIIDRFEGSWAVCEKEDGSMMNIHRTKLPSEAKEGDVLMADGFAFYINREETEKRRNIAKKLVEDLWE